MPSSKKSEPSTLYRVPGEIMRELEKITRKRKTLLVIIDFIVARLSQCVWTTTPRGTVDQKQKFKKALS